MEGEVRQIGFASLWRLVSGTSGSQRYWNGGMWYHMVMYCKIHPTLGPLANE